MAARRIASLLRPVAAVLLAASLQALPSPAAAGVLDEARHHDSPAAILEDLAQRVIGIAGEEPLRGGAWGLAPDGGLVALAPEPAEAAPEGGPRGPTGADLMALVTAPLRTARQDPAAKADDLLACLQGRACPLLTVPDPNAPARWHAQEEIDPLLRATSVLAAMGADPAEAGRRGASAVAGGGYQRPEDEHPLRSLVKLVLHHLGLLEIVRDMPMAVGGAVLGVVGVWALAFELLRARGRRRIRRA